jgi:hypothetical protein
MKTRMRSYRGALCAMFTLAAGLCALVGTAQAAPAPAPSWKLLAVTGPSHLPPRQSAVQRVIVEAEGGTFKLSRKSAEGEGTLGFASGYAETTAGSNVIWVWFPIAGIFNVGQPLSGSGIPAGTTITGISGSPSEPFLELSNNATASSEFAEVSAFSKEVTGVTASSGEFSVGDEVSGEHIPANTTVTAVGAGGSTLTLSDYGTGGGTVALTARAATASLPYDSDASAVQSALEALPGFGPGSAAVSGGPGGSAEHPYFISFGGPFADEDVELLGVNKSGLAGEHAFANVSTKIPGGNGTGGVSILIANNGGADTSGTTTVHFGPLPSGIVTSGPATGIEWNCPGDAGESEVTCTTTRPVKALRASPYPINVPVEVLANAAPSSSATAEISGGGAAAPVTYQMPIVVSKEPAKFGLAAIWAGSYEADGSPSTQAGGHPSSGAAYFLVTTVRTRQGSVIPAGSSKDVVVDLPPGFVGNPLATKRCPQSVPIEPFGGSSELCNDEMSVGTLVPYAGNEHESFNFESQLLYNDVPPKGYAAEFSTRLIVPMQSVLATVDSEGGFGIRLDAPNNATSAFLYGAFTGFEGVPKLGNGQALLTNPVNCAETRERPPVVAAKGASWQEPNNFTESEIVTQPALTGCDKLKFEAKNLKTGEGQVAFSFQPSSTQGSTPVGATAHLHIDNPGLTDANGLATPELKRSVIKLPQGLSLNPSSANGLETCTEAQIGYRGKGFAMPNPIRFTNAQPACPDGSKLGTAEIETPLLENPLVGEVFLAAQEENPFGSLLAIYLVVNDPLTGVIIKLPGEVQTDPVTGRLTTIFDNSPQLPFEDLTLKFRGGGPRSEFATSEVCGAYPTEGEWTPWSAPESGPPAQTTDSFSISSGCSASAGARPFAPSFEAGTTATKAGAYSPLVIKVARKDGEQELSRLDFTLPKGLIGKLAGIPYCTEAQIAAAEAKTGKAEQASSSCSAASRIGSVDTAAGVGSEPVHVGGNVYLAGPYKGAPVSAVVVTPGIAGPFDLGNVVVRAPLYIDPESAQLTTKSDPIPTILKGIPLKVRSVTISIDRSGFILNPTSCEVKSATASITGGSGATATPSNRFQVGGCSDLGFTPKLSLSLKGGTKRSGNPALTAVLTQPAGQAGIGKVSVALPHSEFLDQSHIRTVCTRVQFSAHACPPGAIYGEAEAVTPLLDQPLRGPVYLRSSSNKLPDLVVALRGPDSQPIEVVLAGRIDSVNGGIRNSFELVPDAPVSKFVLRMQGGKKGLLVNSTDICLKTNRATVKMEGQNGKLASSSPPLTGQCKSARKNKGHNKKAHKSRSRSKRLAEG